MELRDEIAGIVEDLWATLLHEDVAPLPPGASVDPASPVHARLTIDARDPVELVLECSETLASRAAARMFRLEEGDASMGQVLEAVAELTNILAGNLRGQLAPDAKLGLPEVHLGPAAMPGATGAHASVAFACGDGGFTVRVGPRS